MLPAIPTMYESGVKNFEVTSITGILAPVGTPPDVIKKVNETVHKVLSMPAVKNRFSSIALETIPGTPEQFANYIREDYARWTKVVKDANIPTN